MGKPMVRNLLKAGYSVMVYNRSRAAMDDLATAGAELADSIAHLTQSVSVVMTCVSDSPDVEAIVFEEDGILNHGRSGMLFVDFSTIAAATSRRVYQALQTKGVNALDAPVSGGDIGAQQGTLSIMVGGDSDAFDRALPMLQAMGKNIVHIGEAGAGQITKACNQIVVAMTVQGVAEALTLAKKSGVDGAKVREALLGGFAQSKVMEVHGQKMLDRNFNPGFKLDLFRKDMNIVLQTAMREKLFLPGSANAAEQMNALQAQGKGNLDFIAVLTLYEMLAGISLPD